MNNILSISKSGLNSMQNKMNVVADDLANVNTHGYKRKEISFQELLNNGIYDNEVLMSDNVNNASINAGSRSGIGTINFVQGTILESTGEFHMAMEGKGFFGVRDENGNLMLTRNGGFHLNENHTISDDSGYPLDIEFYIPVDQWVNGLASISNMGEISMEIDGQTKLLGKVILYNPEVLDSLAPRGEGRYMPSQNVMLYNSIEHGEEFGNIVQYSLEASNVEMGKSIVEMITTQRAYSFNAKAIQTTDDIMSIINNIKR